MSTNYMDEYRTMTGYTLTEALRGLVEVLPPQAYKEVKGKTGMSLTDIDPSYLTQEMTRLFGMVGIGWYYNYFNDPLIESENLVSSKGREYTSYMCIIEHLELFYRYVDGKGELHWSTPIVSNGGASNENKEWAYTGALTNAIGGAAKRMCWQLLVFQNKLDHKNAASKYKAQQERKLELPEPEDAPSLEQVTNTTAVPTPEQVTNTTSAPQVVSTSAAPTPEQVSDALETVEWARTVVIPANMGITFSGKPLSAAMTSNSGKKTIQWLAGEVESPNKGWFKPTEDQKELHRAAVVLWKELNK